MSKDLSRSVRRPHLFPLGLLFLNFFLGFLIYSNTFHSGFHFDGIGSIRDNPFLRPPYPLFKSCEGDNVTRCFTFLTFAFNFRMHGLSVSGYHLINLLLHVGASLLVFRMFQLLSASPRARGCIPENSAGWAAWAASLVFLCHPIQTQAVTYIWQRFAVLATFLYLLSLVSYLTFRFSGRRFFYALSLSAMLLALFSKEIAATLPVMILLAEWLFFDGSTSMKKRLQGLAPFAAAVLLIPAAVAASGKLGFYLRPHFYYGYPTAFGADYFFTQLHVIRTYLRLLVFPVGQNLDYDFPVSHSFFSEPVLLSAALLLFLLAAAFYIRSRHRLIFWGLLWFFVSLSVESGILPIRDVIFEHRLYLPMAGFAAVLVYSAFAVLREPQKAMAALGVVVLIFSALTYERNKVWKSEITIWEDVIQKSPAKARGYARLCLAWKEEKNFARAIPYCLRAVELSPRNPATYNNLGAMYGEQKKFLQAAENFKKAIGYSRKNLDDRHLLGHSYNNLANVRLLQGKLREALLFYNKAVDSDPLNPSAHFNRAVALLKSGSRASAKTEQEILFQLGALPLAGQLESLLQRSANEK